MFFVLTVRPAALLPLPDVYTAIGATFSMNFSSWDFAVDGSPSSRTYADATAPMHSEDKLADVRAEIANRKWRRPRTLMSPRRRIPSLNFFREPAKSEHASARLISGCP